MEIKTFWETKWLHKVLFYLTKIQMQLLDLMQLMYQEMKKGNMHGTWSEKVPSFIVFW